MWDHGPPVDNTDTQIWPPPSKSVDRFWYVTVSGSTYFLYYTYTVFYRGKFEVSTIDSQNL